MLAPAIASNVTQRRDDGSSEVSLTLRIPAGTFASCIEALRTLGRLTGKNIAGEAGEIRGGAAQVMCELTLKLAERAREIPSGGMVIEVEKFESARKLLSALVKAKQLQVLASGSNQRTDGTWVGGFRLGIQADQMEDTVTRLAALGRVASRQISGLGLGDLSRTDPNTIGVIQITLAEKAALAPAPQQTSDSVRAKLRDALAGLYASFGWIIYGLIVMAPWLVIVLGLGWMATKIRARRRQAKGGATN